MTITWRRWILSAVLVVALMGVLHGLEWAGAQDTAAPQAESHTTCLVSVRDFGAVGDGKHDDTAAFRRAINRGGRIAVPFGAYKLSDTLELRNSACLIGEGFSSKHPEKNTTLVFHGLGEKPAIITRQVTEGGSNAFGLERMVIRPNSWDAETGCTGNGLDIDARITCRLIRVIGFKRHNLFLHGNKHEGAYFSVFDSCAFDLSGSHSVVVGTLSNGITFINCEMRWAGAEAFLKHPHRPGQADGMIVVSGGAGNPGGQFRPWTPENLQIFGGQSAYNSRYGYHFVNLHNAFVVTGYIEGNLSADKKQLRVGPGVLACEIHCPHIAKGGIALEASKISDSVHPNAIWEGARYLGTGRLDDSGRPRTVLLQNLRSYLSGGSHSAIFTETDKAGNLIVGFDGVPPQVHIRPSVHIGQDGTGRLVVDDSITTGSIRLTRPDPSAPNTTVQHEAVAAPTAQLLYRGQVKLTDGIATIDLDAHAEHPAGTFAKISANRQVFLQNQTGWEPVRAIWTDTGQLQIESRNPCEDRIGWLVAADSRQLP